MNDKKIFIECECLNEVLRLEYLDFFDEFSLSIYRVNFLKRRKCTDEIIFKHEDGLKLLEFLKKHVKIGG